MKKLKLKLFVLIPMGVISAIGGMCLAKLGPYQNAFNSGETAEKVMYRVDLAQYGSSCETLENMVIIPQGAALRRPGTEYIATAEVPQ